MLNWFIVLSGLLYPSTLYVHSIKFSDFAVETPTKNLDLST